MYEKSIELAKEFGNDLSAQFVTKLANSTVTVNAMTLTILMAGTAAAAENVDRTSDAYGAYSEALEDADKTMCEAFPDEVPDDFF